MEEFKRNAEDLRLWTIPENYLELAQLVVYLELSTFFFVLYLPRSLIIMKY